VHCTRQHSSYLPSTRFSNDKLTMTLEIKAFVQKLSSSKNTKGIHQLVSSISTSFALRLKIKVPNPFASLLTISSAFHSLFRMLFTFPSQYLFAIGLLDVFSFGWNLSPIRAAIPNSSTRQKASTYRTTKRDEYRILTFCDRRFVFFI